MFLAEQGFQHRLIGREAAVEQQHRLQPEPLGQRLFQLLVGPAVTGHQRRGAGARTIAVNPLLEGAFDGGVIGQPQIVVGGKVEVIAPPNLEAPATRPVGGDATAQQARLLALGQRCAQPEGARDCGARHDRAAPARGRVAS